jgi:hypothetical protein
MVKSRVGGQIQEHTRFPVWSEAGARNSSSYWLVWNDLGALGPSTSFRAVSGTWKIYVNIHWVNKWLSDQVQKKAGHMGSSSKRSSWMWSVVFSLLPEYPRSRLNHLVEAQSKAQRPEVIPGVKKWHCYFACVFYFHHFYCVKYTLHTIYYLSHCEVHSSVFSTFQSQVFALASLLHDGSKYVTVAFVSLFFFFW